ncbi:ATP-dependent helicase/nuclease subunit A [Salsuginibacillus halophilus]|uniref:DNA 3'-5' helicase n=1 Tax=Salsuginibacillus halophilus TaxID=517424 RepID=A0A2P8HWL6_9BACI|nr:UvrD-helicase domain-containing protein [Salsuginibacillus halophilus]PSL50609.1 ATP-dependent helicase/nuclease subunit A [Salsuginibacillus halophilus]
MTRLQDEQEREAILHELNENFVVEAGAGSGKTYSLVQRMVNTVASGAAEVHEIAAITFTQKAAQEMEERFRKALKEEAASAEGEKKLHCEQALAEVDQIYIGTVHAFCTKMLHERPVEAGLDLEFETIEDREEQELLDKVWDKFIQQKKRDDPETMQELISTGIELQEIRPWLEQVRTYADVNWPAHVVNRPDIEEAVHQIERFVHVHERNIPDTATAADLDAAQKQLIDAKRYLQYVRRNNDEAKIQLLEMFEKPAKVTMKRWLNADAAKELRDSTLPAFCETIAATLFDYRAYRYPKVITVLQDALSVYEAEKQRQSKLTYHDLLTVSVQMLKHNLEVRAFFREKYRVLLVDEFQDTDPVQAELVMLLASDDDHSNWREMTPRPGSLFVVGDPKQSIYRFRRADIQIYQEMKNIIKNTNGRVLPLTMNFRTSKAVTEPLNEAFQKMLPALETSTQASYRPLIAPEPAAEEEMEGIYQLTLDAGKKADVLKREATIIAGYIQQKVQLEAARPQDFMILTRYNEGMDIYRDALKTAGIPATAATELNLSDDPVWQELCYLYEAVAAPHRPLNIVRLYRGPLFGLSDDDFVAEKAAGQALTIETEEKAGTNFQKANEELSNYRQYVHLYSPIDALEKIAFASAWPLLASDRKEPEKNLSRLHHLLTLVRRENANGSGTFAEAVQTFRSFVEEGGFEDAVLPHEYEAVQILNVHKAKGLEAPYVFLAHPVKFITPGSRSSEHIERVSGEGSGYFWFSKKTGMYQSKTVAHPHNAEELFALETAYSEAEETRLTYVAATRAEQMIVISRTNEDDKKQKNPWQHLISSLPPLEEINTNFNLIQAVKTDEPDVGEGWFSLESETEAWINEKSSPTYSETAATAMIDEKRKPPMTKADLADEEMSGPEWGALVHKALEDLMNHQEITSEWLAQLCQEFGFADKLRKLEAIIVDFQNEELYKKVNTARQAYTEMPFTYFDDQEKTTISGVIDLVYEDDDGWHLVDFKTNRFQNEDEKDAISEYYQPQLMYYKQAFQLAFVKPSTISLYLLHTQERIYFT